MTKPKRTGIVYCRTSTASQREAETINAQTERCTRLLERHGIRLLPYGAQSNGWVIDDGVSGSLLEGREFSTFIDDLEAKRVKPEVLVVFSLSRISRLDKSSRETARLVKSATDNARIKALLLGERVIVIDEDGENDPASVIFDLKLTLSTEEYRLIRLRTMSGKARRLSEGKFAKGGRPPYGYKQVACNGDHRKHGWELAPHAEEAEHLKAILDWYIEGGPTYAARQATAAKIPTPMARTEARRNKAKDWTPTRWSPVSVQHLARNVRAYLGETSYEFSGETHTVKYPPLINFETYAAVERRKKTKTLKRRATFLTTGLVDCSCGGRIHERNSHDKHYARCRKGCGSLHQERFEAVLWAATVARLVQIRQHERASANGADPFAHALKAAQARLKAVQAAMDQLLDLHLTAGLDKPTWKRRNDPLNERKTQAQAEIERIQRDKRAHEERRVNEESVEARIDATLKLVRTAPPLETKRATLSNLLQGERVVVSWPKSKKTLRPKCSPYASITFPAFGTLAAVTVRTDEDVWTKMLGAEKQKLHVEARGAGRKPEDVARMYIDAVLSTRGKVVSRVEYDDRIEIVYEVD